MSETIYYFIIAAILVALIPIVPKFLCLRIKILRFLRWKSLADWHARHFGGLVIAVRAIMGVIAIVVLILGIKGL
ncbi:MAG: hypothetical protein KOO62_08195 [candidate division Zixibacteria bacterium]|nr:hypothetical protein [candidate division Zixibacteria bacterium]